ncbi:tryptophan synthase subunit alpha [Chloroflexota bacterium]
MKRLSEVFDAGGRTALIAYVTVGYPTIEATLELVPLLAENGCDIIELGIPFSDPLADGATIQKASHVALENGVTPDVCLDVASRLSARVETPLVFMSYYNPILHRGLESFCDACTKAGVSGLIVPDLPPDEGSELEAAATGRDLGLIYLLAPTATDERVRLAAGHSTGFLYLVSLAGVTGARSELPEGLEDFVDRVRTVAKQPLCVGFGISSPVQAARVASIADGVIVGSRILQLAEEDPTLARVASFVRDLRVAIDSVGS